MSQKVILLNGYSGSGKDYVGNLLVDQIKMKGKSVKKISLSAPALEIVRRFYSLNQSHLDELLLDKNRPSYLLGGISLRHAMRHVCENVIKPVGGKDFFVNKLLSEIQDSFEQVIIVSDLGFREELNVIEEECIDLDSYLIVRIHGEKGGKKIEPSEHDLRTVFYDDLLFDSLDIFNTHGKEPELDHVIEWLFAEQ